jgi:hypothetical protein
MNIATAFVQALAAMLHTDVKSEMEGDAGTFDINLNVFCKVQVLTHESALVDMTVIYDDGFGYEATTLNLCNSRIPEYTMEFVYNLHNTIRYCQTQATYKSMIFLDAAGNILDPHATLDNLSVEQCITLLNATIAGKAETPHVQESIEVALPTGETATVSSPEMDA